MGVRFQNDLGYRVRFTECRTHSCAKFDDSWTLSSGQSAVDSLSDRGGERTRIITRPSGAVVGCIRLIAERWFRRLAMNLGETEPCTSSRVLTPLDIQHSTPQKQV